jgi:hypothetical protein
MIRSSCDGTREEAGLQIFHLRPLDLSPSRRHLLAQRRRLLTTSAVDYGLFFQLQISLVSRQYPLLFSRSQSYRQSAFSLKPTVLSRTGHHPIKASSTGVCNAWLVLEVHWLTRRFLSRLSRHCCWLSCCCTIQMALSTAFNHISQRNHTTLE